MRLLFIGGTSFLGRHAVERAIAVGHDVTVFHRGRTNPGLLADRVEHRLGDRDGDLASLDTGERWDALVDVCAYVPRQVHRLADVLGDRGGHHVQVSSVSAYDPAAATVDEDAALYDDPPPGEVDAVAYYGPLKAACERAAIARFGASSTAVVRPAYVCGPFDPLDNFNYWVRRMATGGAVVVRDASAPIQIIDARDLGAFLVRCATTQAAGAFDGVAPFVSTAAFLAALMPDGVRAELVEVAAATLAEVGMKLPMMLDLPNDDIISSRTGTQAVAAGLTTRPLGETVAATRAWDDERGRPPLPTAPTPEVEAAALAAHRRRAGLAGGSGADKEGTTPVG